MTDILIRPITSSDREGWLPLWHAYVKFYRGEIPDIVTDTTWQRLISQSDDMCALVACHPNGRLVGFAHYIFHSSTWSVDPYCYLEDLFVVRWARGDNMGAALIESVAAKAKEKHCKRLYWQTQEYNGAARSLYDTLADRSSFVIYRKRDMA